MSAANRNGPAHLTARAPAETGRRPRYLSVDAAADRTAPPPSEVDRLREESAAVEAVREQLAAGIARVLRVADELRTASDDTMTEAGRRLSGRRGRPESRLAQWAQHAARELEDAAATAMAALTEAERLVFAPVGQVDGILAEAAEAARQLREEAADEVQATADAAASDRRAAAELLRWVEREFDRLAARSRALEPPGSGGSTAGPAGPAGPPGPPGPQR